MSKKQLVIGTVIAVVVLAAIGSAAGSKNTLAPSAPPVAVASGSAPAGTGPAPSDAAPSTAGASAGASYGVGDRVKLADEEFISVEKVEAGFTSRFAKPAAGNVNVSFLIAIEGINPAGASYNPFFFKIKDESGFEYNYSAFGKEPQLQSSNDLAPGKIARGWMTFEVPKASKTLTLSYTPGFIGEPVEFVYVP